MPRRLQALQGVAELRIDREVQDLAEALIAKGGFPAGAEADALHIAVATVHRIDYLLTWNFRHIDNEATDTGHLRWRRIFLPRDLRACGASY